MAIRDEWSRVCAPRAAWARLTARRRSDFQKEVSAIEALIRSRGHICMLSPKGHCELAGCGIEYDWGKMKIYFRRNNSCNLKKFHALIVDSLAHDNLSIETSRKFARKARAYRRAYREGVDNEHTQIENMIKTFRTHRSAFDFAGAYIRQA